jgi:hypothetical protein
MPVYWKELAEPARSTLVISWFLMFGWLMISSALILAGPLSYRLGMWLFWLPYGLCATATVLSYLDFFPINHRRRRQP